LVTGSSVFTLRARKHQSKLFVFLWYLRLPMTDVQHKRSS
jgi:hypothetical protein